MPVGGVPRDGLRARQGIAAGNGTLAGADQPRCGFEPARRVEETLAVVRLGLAEALRRTLATTNPIESTLSVMCRVTARVMRWREGGAAAAVVCGGPASRRETVPPGQGASCPTDAHQGPGRIHLNTAVWNGARRRVRLARGDHLPS
jgi:hypothetical protein